MSYSLQIHGSKHFDTPEEAKAHEEAVAAAAREFVKTLAGVNVATGTFGTIGSHNLMEADR